MQTENGNGRGIQILTEEQKERRRARRTANPEIKAREKAWKAANVEKIRAQEKAYRATNSEKINAQARARHEANPGKKRAQHSTWYEANKEKVCARLKAQREANPEKYKALNNARYAATPEKHKASRIKGQYGLSQEGYVEMYIKQEGCCAACGRHRKSIFDKDGAAASKLFIDHCHKTNVVRGLLCTNCNFALGLVNDSIETLSGLINYLRT